LAFETELMEVDGRYIRTAIRQPDLDEARCYFICRSCACHTYMTTQWVGFRLYGSEDAAVTWSGDDPIPANNKHVTNASNRKAWRSGEVFTPCPQCVIAWQLTGDPPQTGWGCDECGGGITNE